MFSYNSNCNAQVCKKNSLFQKCPKDPLLPLPLYIKTNTFENTSSMELLNGSPKMSSPYQ